MPRGIHPSAGLTTRVCALEGCDEEFTPKQANQRFCKVWHKNLDRIKRQEFGHILERLEQHDVRLSKLESNGKA